jgi:short subunit dehydrogenase-like uncharacterized protein
VIVNFICICCGLYAVPGDLIVYYVAGI